MKIHLFHRLRGDERGASVIEFALFAPILAVMVMGITDLSMAYSRKLVVEAAIYRALEKVQVGSFQTDYTTYLRSEAATGAGVPTSEVTVDSWLECNRIRQASFTGLCSTGQDTARYVSVAIATTYEAQFTYGPLNPGTDGEIPIAASASLRIQ